MIQWIFYALRSIRRQRQNLTKAIPKPSMCRATTHALVPHPFPARAALDSVLTPSPRHDKCVTNFSHAARRAHQLQFFDREPSYRAEHTLLQLLPTFATLQSPQKETHAVWLASSSSALARCSGISEIPPQLAAQTSPACRVGTFFHP